MQEYNYRIVHRPGEKHCNAEGLKRRAMRSQSGKKAKKKSCEIQSVEKALGGAQEDLNSGSSSKKERCRRNSARKIVWEK